MEIIKYSDVYKFSLKNFLKTMYNVLNYTFPPERMELDLEDVFARCIESGGEFLLLCKDKEVVGTVGFKVSGKNKEIAEVKRLFVLPEYQGNGYGEKLLLSLIEQAKNKGVCYLRLCTTNKSQKAIKLYEKTGFYKIPAYKPSPFVEVYMELKLQENLS